MTTSYYAPVSYAHQGSTFSAATPGYTAVSPAPFTGAYHQHQFAAAPAPVAGPILSVSLNDS